MPNDNTLGAPTEGLGQRVTFSFDAKEGLPQLQVGGPTRQQTGVQGGGTAGLGQTMMSRVEAPPPNPTMDLLMKVGDAILRPKLEKARTEAFVSGMQRAMQGEAVTEIAETQPWYSKIFGDSDVVEGARAYAGHTIAQTQVAAMEDKMPELRQMDPDTARKFFIDSVNNSLTGDKATDLMVLKSMTSALPGVMRRQTKEHFGFLQEKASTQEAAAFRSGAQRLQAAAAGLAAGYTTPEEFESLQDDFERSLVPVYGRDPKSYGANIKHLMIGAAANGQFHALSAMQSRKGRGGLIDALDSDDRVAVDKALEAGEAKLRTKYSFAWNDDLARVEAQATKPQTGQTAQDIGDQIDRLNVKFMSETGSKSPLVLPSQRAAMVSGSAVAIARERDRQADLEAARADKAAQAGDKAAAEGIKRSTVALRAAEGSLGTLSANSNYSEEYINEVVTPMYMSMSPQDRTKFLVNNMRESYVIKPIQRALEGGVTSVLGAGQLTPEAQKVFDEYSQFREANSFAAAAYYGKHAIALEGFYNDVKTGSTPEGAFRNRFVNPGSRTKLSGEEMKQAIEVVSKDYNSFLPEWAGGQKLKPGTARRVAMEMADSIEKWSYATGSVKEGTARAMHQHKMNGMEIMGGYTWTNGKGQRPLSEYLTTKTGPGGEAPRATDKLNEEFEYAVEELLYGKDSKTFGIAPETVEDTYVGRLPDKNGVPMFHIQAVVEGKTYSGLLAGTDIYKLAEQRKKRSEAVLPDAPEVISAQQSAAIKARDRARTPTLLHLKTE